MPMVLGPFVDPSVQILADIRRSSLAGYSPNTSPGFFAPAVPGTFAPAPPPPPLPEDMHRWSLATLLRAYPHFI